MKSLALRLKSAKENCNGGEGIIHSNNNALFGAALREKGHAAMRKSRRQLAVHLYTQSIAHEEVSAAVLCHRADAYLKLQMYEEVVGDCTESIKLQPNFWRAYALRAAALRQLRKFSDAISDLRQVEKLCPNKLSFHEKLRLKCRREADALERSFRFKLLTDEALKLPPRPYVRGDKRITVGQLLLRMREILEVINRVLEEPGSGAIIWKEDESDRWKKLRLTTYRCSPSSKSWEKMANADTKVIGLRLQDLLDILKDVGSEGRHALASAKGFSTLLSAYSHHDLLVLEILHEACKDGDAATLREFLCAQPLPTLLEGLREKRPAVRCIAYALLDLAACQKPQRILSLLMREDLVRVVLKSMCSGSVVELNRCVSLFFKLAMDPRLCRHLASSPVSPDLCGGLIRACGANSIVTRLCGVQIIAALLEWERRSREQKWTLSLLTISYPLDASEEYSFQDDAEDDDNKPALLKSFVDHGVLLAVAQLLAREVGKAPEKMDKNAPFIWEDDVEVICKEIGRTVSDFSELHECTLRDLNFLPGYAQVAVLNALRVMNCMVDLSRRAVQVLADQVFLWGMFLSLLLSFPHPLAVFSVQVLRNFCRRSKRIAMHIADMWPANSSLTVLGLACSAYAHGDWKTYEASMLILAELAVYKSFLTCIQNSASFTMLCDLLQPGPTILAVSAACKCLRIAVTACNMCLEMAEVHSTYVLKRLLYLWCECREETQLRCQVEDLLLVLMQRSSVLQQATLSLFQNGMLSQLKTALPCIQHTLSYKPHTTLNFPSQEYEGAGKSYLEFTRTGMNFRKVCSFLATLVQPSADFQPATKFANLCHGAGLLSIQLAKYFREAHCFAVNSKPAWVEQTRRLAKYERLWNLTSVLSKSPDFLPRALPSRVDVAILCLSLESIEDLGYLFQAVYMKLLPEGKLVLIDDDDLLVAKARHYASSKGFNVLQQPRIFEHYSITVLQKL